MVERRSEIQDRHRDRKNHRAEKEAGTAALSFQQQNWRADQRCAQSDSMTDAIRQFFASGLRPSR
jgi:hypothetical protein